jgi:hypothetical protein
VTCTYTAENAWSIALGVGPFTGSRFELSVADAQIGNFLRGLLRDSIDAGTRRSE